MHVLCNDTVKVTNRVQDSDVISEGSTGQNLRRGDVSAASADKC